MSAKITSDLARWKPMALSLPMEAEARAASVPMHVLCTESVDVSKFSAKYWKTERARDTGSIVRPGLDLVGKRLQKSVAADILSLGRALQTAQTDYLLATGDTRDVGLVDRATYVADEIFAVLSYAFDDGVDEERDVQLARLGREYPSPRPSRDELAAKLVAYATLAQRYESELDGLGGFDIRLLAEAHTLADRLRSEGSRPGVQTSLEAKAALALRNRLCTLLVTRMNEVRAAARFVFRDHPELLRGVTSAYERSRRRATARKVAGAAPVTTTPATPPAPAAVGATAA